MASFVVGSAGMLTTVQDTGRYGYQRYGMPVGGAMDIFSLQLANKIVGNHMGEACLEATYTGPEIIFSSNLFISVTGGDMSPLLNGRPMEQYMAVRVHAGDRLSFEGLKSGCRSYIAFSGGIKVPVVMGSRSTYLRGRLGGFEGRALRTGDEIPLGISSGFIQPWEVPSVIKPEYRSDQILRIIPGPETDHFDMHAIQNFLTGVYTVTPQSDRMGYRLSGTEINHNMAGADIISAGISPGTIQVPGNGQPIILMADRQTTGGYARIANIISVDLTLASQLTPGDTVRFSEIAPGQATDLYRERTGKISR